MANFMMKWESLNRQKRPMTLKPMPICGRSQVTSSLVVTTNLGFNSKCRRRKHALFQLKYMDVTWSIHIDLNVLQEKRIDDHWNADLNRHLSDSWRGFTKFHFLQGKPPTAYIWSGWCYSQEWMKRWWSDSMECCCYLRNIQDILADGKTPYERRFGEPFKGPRTPFGALIECHQSSPKDQLRIHHFDNKVLPVIFRGCELNTG